MFGFLSVSFLNVNIANIGSYYYSNGTADPEFFILKIDTEISGETDNDQFKLMGTEGEFDVKWGDGSESHDVTGDIVHTYDSPGRYTVKISPDITRIKYDNAQVTSAVRDSKDVENNDAHKILEIKQWGEAQWSRFDRSFSGSSNLIVTAHDTPDLSEATKLGVGKEAGWGWEGGMFDQADLSTAKNIENWDVSNIEDFGYLFAFSNLDVDLSGWDMSNAVNVRHMFRSTPFNHNLNEWDVSNVNNFGNMFRDSPYNHPLDQWDMSNAMIIGGMFRDNEAFDQPIDGWDVSNVTEMTNLFRHASSFNQDLNSWDTGNVIYMDRVFGGASNFNGDITNWDVSNVEDMFGTFEKSNFNRDISGWEVDNVTNMGNTFRDSPFNQDISDWNTSNVTNMSQMFRDADSFNQDLGAWDVSEVTDMFRMFREASSFDQDLGSWEIYNVTDMSQMLINSGLSVANYDSTLIGWALQDTLQDGVELGANSLEYCDGVYAKQILTDEFNWEFTGDQGLCELSLEKPNLIEPIDNSSHNDDEVNLIWNTDSSESQINELINFTIQIAEDVHFQNYLVDKSNLDSTTYTFSELESNRTYYWRIRENVGNESGDWSNVWSFETESITNTSDEERIPKNTTLKDNYPNPFNDVTRIRYTISEQEHVSISVYNAVGHLVTTLVDETMESGVYDVEFDSSGLSSGTYLYKMRTESHMDTKPMMLIK